MSAEIKAEGKGKREIHECEAYVKIKVSDVEVGQIIGCGGKMKKMLENKSNAVITIAGVKGDKTRAVVITGTWEAMNKAKALVLGFCEALGD
jgi:predicted RNA-binding protein YlqC (UPF0109 family)